MMNKIDDYVLITSHLLCIKRIEWREVESVGWVSSINMAAKFARPKTKYDKSRKSTNVSPLWTLTQVFYAYFKASHIYLPYYKKSNFPIFL